MVSFLQPYSSAQQAPRITTDPLRSTRPHPREGAGDSITCQNTETRRKAKRRSLMTTFSHRLIPVVSATRSSNAVLADLRRHSDTCTSASNTIQILCRSSEMAQPCSQSKHRRGRGEPTKPSPGQFPGGPVPALSIQYPTQRTPARQTYQWVPALEPCRTLTNVNHLAGSACHDSELSRPSEERRIISRNARYGGLFHSFQHT